MRIGNAIAEFAPAAFVSLAIALLASCLTFGLIFLLASKFALGIDFVIIVGMAVGAAIGVGTFLVSLRIIRAKAQID
jgi:hypothetical protein